MNVHYELWVLGLATSIILQSKLGEGTAHVSSHWGLRQVFPENCLLVYTGPIWTPLNLVRNQETWHVSLAAWQVTNIFRVRTLGGQVQILEDPFLPARIKGLTIFEHLALLPRFGDTQTRSDITSCLKSQEAPTYFLSVSYCGAVRKA